MALKNVTSSAYEALLFSTAFSVAFFGCLRIGEIIATGKSGDNSRIIQISDVVVYDESVKITLRFSKTDQYGESATLVFYPSQQKHICPASLIKKFNQVRPKAQGPFFVILMANLSHVISFHPYLIQWLSSQGQNCRHVLKATHFELGLPHLQALKIDQIQISNKWADGQTKVLHTAGTYD